RWWQHRRGFYGGPGDQAATTPNSAIRRRTRSGAPVAVVDGARRAVLGGPAEPWPGGVGRGGVARGPRRGLLVSPALAGAAPGVGAGGGGEAGGFKRGGGRGGRPAGQPRRWSGRGRRTGR